MTATLSQPAPCEPLTPAWFPLRKHREQSRLWRTSARFVTCAAGRRSGKTELAKRRLVRWLQINRRNDRLYRYAFLAPTRPQGKQIAWRHLKRLVPEHWLAGRPYEGDLMMRCIFKDYETGHVHESELWVIGMDRPQRFEGSPWDGVVEDEASDQREDIHLAIRPALADTGGWWWKIGVPKRKGTGARGFRKQCQFAESGIDPVYANFTWPCWDILPSSEVEQLKKDLDPKDFAEQAGGQWQDIGGAAFYQFNKVVNVRPCTYDPTRPILVACDFNVTPMAWVICQTTPDGKGLETFDEIWLNDTNTQRTLDVLWNRYGPAHRGGWFFYGDVSGNKRQSSAAFSDYTQIANDKRFKAQVRVPGSQPGVKDRLASCNSLLCNAAGQVRWWIDPRCEHLLDDLEYRALNKDGHPTDAGTSGGTMGHISDAVGYLIHAKWPVTIIEHEGTSSIGVYFGEG
jgi:hypothetical protein